MTTAKIIETIIIPSFYGLIILVFLITLILILKRLKLLSLYQQRIRRLKVDENKISKHQAIIEQTKQSFNKFISYTNKLFYRLHFIGGESDKKLSDRLSSAGWRGHHVSTIFLLSRISVPIIISSCMLWLNYNFLYPRFDIDIPIQITIIGAILGILATNMFVESRIRQYRNQVRKALPDALELMVICYEAGYNNVATLERISMELVNFYPEMAGEFNITAAELSLSPNRTTAWENFADRTELKEIRAIVSVLKQNDKYGTPLAKALRDQISLFRKERLANAEKKAAKIPVYLAIPLTIFFIPILFIIILSPAIMRVIEFV